MPADAGEDGEDPVIRAERAHLIQSREYLRLMRENVLAENPMAADPVSLEYLKADLYRRAESLKDLPDAPLFFGRLDYTELAPDEKDSAGSARREGSGGRPPGLPVSRSVPEDPRREAPVSRGIPVSREVPVSRGVPGGRPSWEALHIGRRHVH